MNAQVKGLQIAVTYKISLCTYLSYENSITALLLLKVKHKRVSHQRTRNKYANLLTHGIRSQISP